MGYRVRGLPRTLEELNQSLQLLGSLRERGWHASAAIGRPIDGAHLPIPWLTYPAIDWLTPRLREHDAVFEFGSGHSTLWFASRVASVHAVEHDSRWYRYVDRASPRNVHLLLKEGSHDAFNAASPTSPYVNAIADCSIDGFDVVLVDGVERNDCIIAAIPYLKDSGLLIVDNSDRPGMRRGLDYLERHGFGRIDFVGLLPGLGILGCTSVCLRDGDRWLRTPAVRPRFLGW